MPASSAPRVTVITPSFNQAAFLEQTIQSVLSQNYPNLEYWIVDGGSTDGSVDIIRKYADRLAGWVSEKDHGQAEAINKGFARATGEIVIWINSDDYFLPGSIAAAVQVLRDQPDLGLVFGDVVSINGEGEPINVMTYDDWGLDDLMQFNIIGQPGVYMRRSVLEKSGYLDLNYHYLLDHHLWLRMAQFASMRYVPQRWAAARFHAGAKNVNQAAGFGRESLRLAGWMSTEPGLAERYQRLRRRVWAGAYRMNGRYLLDGAQSWSALRSYLHSLWLYPPIALQEKRRILFALASLFVNVDRLRSSYLEQRQRRLKTQMHDPLGKS